MTKELFPAKFSIERTMVWEEWRETCFRRLHYASKLKIRHLPQLEPHTGKCAIVGAGPTVKDYLNEIKAIRGNDFNSVMTLNAAHDWLIKQGIKPRIHVIFEDDNPDVQTVLGGLPHKEVTYYIASHCPETIFKQLEGYNRVLWHPFMAPQEYQQAIARWFPGEFMVCGGYATFFRTMAIATILGFRDFDLFGLDSSYEEDSSHIDDYPTVSEEPKINIYGRHPTTNEIRQFSTKGGLAFQANEFVEFCKVNQAGLKLRVHGNSLLRYLHESRYPEQYLNS